MRKDLFSALFVSLFAISFAVANPETGDQGNKDQKIKYAEIATPITPDTPGCEESIEPPVLITPVGPPVLISE